MFACYDVSVFVLGLVGCGTDIADWFVVWLIVLYCYVCFFVCYTFVGLWVYLILLCLFAVFCLLLLLWCGCWFIY